LTVLVLSFRVQSKQLSQAKEAHDVEIVIARQERRRLVARKNGLGFYGDEGL
jgi:hypothetical protein